MLNRNHFLFIPVALLFLSCSEDIPIVETKTDCSLTSDEILVVDELNSKYAYTFNNAVPDDYDSSLDYLIDYLGDSKIVGLGEGTHGTSEFFSMKDKIFRQLALKKEFNAVIFEIPWGHAMKVNDFVVKGIGDVNSVIDQTYYWVYDTQEVRDLAQWIYEINLTRTDGNKIFFVGCDPQGGDFNIEEDMVYDYLNVVAPDDAFDIISKYGSLPYSLQNYDELSKEEKMINRDRVDEVYQYMIDNKEDFVVKSSEFDYQVALMASHVIKHREYIYRVQQFGTPRDSLMAIYTDWWQQIVEVGAKVAVWAHNFHVMDGRSLNGDWMGSFLKRKHQDNYKNVAFTFGTGCLNAFVSNSQGKFAGAVQKQTVPWTSCLTVNNTLTKVDGDQHYIIFDEVNYASYSGKYFMNPNQVYQMGAGFNYKFIFRYTQRLELSRLFDVLIHFDYTNESQLS